MRLSKFIRDNIEVILQEWDDFAVALHPRNTASTQIRIHAQEMLQVICTDLDTHQAVEAGIEKSRGHAPVSLADTAAEAYAMDWLLSGFTTDELMAVYRAMRASVLRLWQARVRKADEYDLQDMLRFNEAIDQALTASLRRYSAMLQASQNVFLSILGHDVRNPLGAISMGAQLFLQDSTLSARHTKVATQVLNSTNRITEIVADMLDFSTSHLGSGIPVTLGDVDIGLECTAVVQEMKLFHPERTFRLQIEIDLMVQWDRARMCQALSNLIANAVQYGDAESPIWIKVCQQKERVFLTVHNEGNVIDAAKLRNLFDPLQSFAMKSAKERSATGTDNLGLGLYIAHEIVRAHGGEIKVSSSAEEGTTFTVSVPIDGAHTTVCHELDCT